MLTSWKPVKFISALNASWLLFYQFIIFSLFYKKNPYIACYNCFLWQINSSLFQKTGHYPNHMALNLRQSSDSIQKKLIYYTFCLTSWVKYWFLFYGLFKIKIQCWKYQVCLMYKADSSLQWSQRQTQLTLTAWELKRHNLADHTIKTWVM